MLNLMNALAREKMADSALCKCDAFKDSKKSTRAMLDIINKLSKEKKEQEVVVTTLTETIKVRHHARFPVLLTLA